VSLFRPLPPGHWLLPVLLLLPVAQGSAHPAVETRISRLDQLVQAHPQEQALYIQRGALYARHGQWQPALDDLALAETLGEPQEVGFEQGRLRYRQQKYTLAREAFSRYLTLHPGHPEALLYRARAARAEGDTDAALADFLRHFAAADRPHPGDLIAAARLLETQGDSGRARAIALLDGGLDRLGMQPQLQRHAIGLELQRDNVAAALRRCRELETVLGQSPRWQLEMAQLLLRSEHRDEAALLLERARAQLDDLRPTPARRELRVEIERLQTSGLEG